MQLSDYKLVGKCLMYEMNKIKSVGSEDWDLVEKVHKLT
jgi:hypothetical protein